MRWTTYAFATLAFNVAGVFVVYALQRLRAGCRSILSTSAPSPHTSRSTPP
jgi:K+-transporting ATPase A subunit